MSKEFILALDQGTTSSRSILFDHSGAIVAQTAEPFRQIYPQPAWVEHDPGEIWASQLNSAKAAIQQAAISPDDIAAIGITNQRETSVLWERRSGRPIHNAIVWQCRRTADLCERLKAEGCAEDFGARTGLVLDAYFSGTKVKWLLDNVWGAREQAARGELCFGTIDSWLLFKLTGLHATDHTNASRTLMYNINSLEWDDSILRRLDIPFEILPRVMPSSHVYGVTRVFGPEIPVTALCGDQQSALFGQAGFAPGECKNTYGTGCFVLANTGRNPVRSRHGLITTIAFSGVSGENGDGGVEYALEGSVFIGGAVVQWLRDELGIIATAAESEQVAATVEDSNGVCIVPAFVGLGAPHWDMHARGIITGLTRGANRAHIVRAALESISFQSADVIRCMESDCGKGIQALRVDGGAAANDLLMQHQADVLGAPVVRGQVIETTALGAAFLAGLAIGSWKDKESLRGIWKGDRTFYPEWNEGRRRDEVLRWQKAVNLAKLL
jgi:glycerol kinase